MGRLCCTNHSNREGLPALKISIQNPDVDGETDNSLNHQADFNHTVRNRIDRDCQFMLY